VQKDCLACHSPSGEAADRDLTTYANISKLQSTTLLQVSHCLMPPAGANPGMTPAERTELVRWLVCGAPQN
jgi:hypothetical protein